MPLIGKILKKINSINTLANPKNINSRKTGMSSLHKINREYLRVIKLLSTVFNLKHNSKLFESILLTFSVWGLLKSDFLDDPDINCFFPGGLFGVFPVS